MCDIISVGADVMSITHADFRTLIEKDEKITTVLLYRKFDQEGVYYANK